MEPINVQKESKTNELAQLAGPEVDRKNTLGLPEGIRNRIGWNSKVAVAGAVVSVGAMVGLQQSANADQTIDTDTANLVNGKIDRGKDVRVMPLAEIAYVFEVDIPGLPRGDKVRQVLVEKNGKANGHNYSVRPPFALLERSKPKKIDPATQEELDVVEEDPSKLPDSDPLKGYPWIVLDKAETDRGEVLLFSAALESPHVEEQVKMKLAEKLGVDPSEVDVSPWGITQAAVKIKNILTEELLGVGITGALAGAPTARFAVEFTPEKLESFKKAMAANQVYLEWNFTDRAVSEGTSEIYRNAVMSLHEDALAGLTAKQKAGLEPLTVMEQEEVARRFTVSVLTQIRVDGRNKEAIALLMNLVGPDEFIQQVFREQESRNYQLLSEHQKLAIAERLRPLLESKRVERGNTEVTTERDAHHRTKTAGGSASIGAVFDAVTGGISGSAGFTKTDIKELERQTGVSFKQIGESQTWTAISASMKTIDTTRLNTRFEEAGQIIVIGPEGRSQKTPLISARFTYEHLEEDRGLVGELKEADLKIAQLRAEVARLKKDNSDKQIQIDSLTGTNGQLSTQLAAQKEETRKERQEHIKWKGIALKTVPK